MLLFVTGVVCWDWTWTQTLKSLKAFFRLKEIFLLCDQTILRLRVWSYCVKWSWRPGRSPPAAGSVCTSCASLPLRSRCSSSVQPGSAAGCGPPLVQGGRAGAPEQSPACAGCLRRTGKWVYASLSWSHRCGCSFSELSPSSDRSWSCGCPCVGPSTRPASPCSWRWSGRCRCRCQSTGLSRPCWGHSEPRGGIHKAWASFGLRREKVDLVRKGRNQVPENCSSKVFNLRTFAVPLRWQDWVEVRRFILRVSQGDIRDDLRPRLLLKEQQSK